MELDIIQFLREQPVALLFTVIGTGYLIGNIRIFGLQLGASGGVLFAALFLGHFNFELPVIVERIGFVFFIYSVGIQSGPRFFSALRDDGKRYVAIALVVGATALLMVVGMAKVFNLEQGYKVGILGGSLTSTSSLAAAQDALNNGMIATDPKLTIPQVQRNITVGYAITYVFGLLGLILFIQLFPKLIGIDLKREAEIASQGSSSHGSGSLEFDDPVNLHFRRQSMRLFTVTNPDIVGKTLADIDLRRRSGCTVVKMQRSDAVLVPSSDIALQEGDLLVTIGTAEALHHARKILGGTELNWEQMDDNEIVTRHVMVTSREMVGRTLPETGILHDHGCVIERYIRGGIEIPLSADLKLEKGDNMFITGLRDKVERAAQRLGYVVRSVHETDLLTFAMGIVAGIFLGSLHFAFGNLSLTIGMAGGLLLTGLLIGHLRAQHPSFGSVPPAARFILRELGILLFLAGVGMRAGHGLLEGIMASGLQILISGIMVTLVPVVVGYLFGRYVLRLKPIYLFGALAGAMTSTPSLNVINKTAESTLPSIGYAGAYAVANILLTMLGPLLLLI